MTIASISTRSALSSTTRMRSGRPAAGTAVVFAPGSSTGAAATGSNLWSVTGLPLQVNKSNVVTVVAATTSWVPAYRGSTTFNDALTVLCYPIQATLASSGTNALLNWSGGEPPYRVQCATDLAAGDWMDFLNDATPPVSLPLTGQAGFYRLVGQ